MACLFLDGFDHYNTSAMMARKWNAVVVSSFPAGRFGRGTGMAWGSGTQLKTLASNFTTLTAGCAVKADVVSTGTKIIEFRDAGTTQVFCAIDSDYHLVVYRGTTANILGTATGFNFKLSTWYYIELKVLFSATVGTVDLQVNSVNVLSLTTQNTKNSANTTASQVAFSGIGSTNTIDDVYINDTSTGTNTGFMNEIEVRTEFPTGDSAVQFTRSTGVSNFANVDDASPNDDTDYNEDAVVGHKDVFTLTALSPAVTTVKTVALTSTMRNTDASARSGRNNLKSNVTTVNGATIALSTSFVMQQDIYDTDPNGAIAWTPTSLNAALPGYEVVS